MLLDFVQVATRGNPFNIFKKCSFKLTNITASPQQRMYHE